MPPISVSAATPSAFWRRKASPRASCNGRWRSRSRRCYALVVGALSLRTRGVYFIMITLAFAQMVYYVAIGLDRYGGDDGLTIHKRSQFGGLIDLNNKTLFYYLCFALLLASIYLVSRIVNSRFGLVDPGRALQRAAHARDRIPGVPLQARLLSSSPARCAGLPARCWPITPTSSARQ